MTALSRFRPKSESGLIPQEQIRECVQWQFGEMVLHDAGAYPNSSAEPSAELRLALDEAFARGLASGRAAVEFEMQEEMERLKVEQQQQAAETLESLLKSVHEGVRDVQVKMADDILSLVVGLSRQVLRLELSQSSVAVLTPVIEEAVRMLKADSELAVIRLHPDDLRDLQPHLQATLDEHPLQWVADSSLSRGGCLVESAGAQIDASLARRWERAVGALGLSTPWHLEDPDAV